MSADGTRVSFRLREGVRWHDGTPFSTRDVAFTFLEVLKKIHGRGKTTFSGLVDVEPPDALTAVFVLAQPNPAMMRARDSRESPVLPARLHEGTDIPANPANPAPVGTGPFRLAEYEVGSHLVLEGNTDDWDAGYPLHAQRRHPELRHRPALHGARSAGGAGISRGSTLGRLARHPSGAVGLVILAVVLAMAASAGLLFPAGPWPIAGAPRTWPGADPAFPLGTDALGRDLLAAVFYGSRVSLMVGAAAALVALPAGTTVGAVAGQYGGRTDDVLMRLTDAMQTIPSFLAAVAIVGVVGASLTTIIAAIAIVSWPMIAGLVRADFLRLRTYDFVQSRTIIGMSDRSIIVGQLLPNCLAPIIVSASVLVATAIITEASLSFLGLGDPNVMNWGTILGIGRQELRTGWYMTAFPAGALVVTVLALSLIGDALNDVLNPRLKERP